MRTLGLAVMGFVNCHFPREEDRFGPSSSFSPIRSKCRVFYHVRDIAMT